MADYQNSLSEFTSRDIRIVALSVDSQEEAEKIKTSEDLTFPIGYGLPCEDTARLTGTFYDAEDEEPYFHAAAFVLDESGQIQLALYSTGSTGRLTAHDSLTFTDHRRKN